MKIFSVAVLLSGVAFGSTSVDSKVFFSDIQGKYSITLINGAVPHAEEGRSTAASVVAQADEGLVTVPYCPPGAGFCDPGYHFFPYDKTNVGQETFPDGKVKYTITLEDGAATQPYDWIESKGTFTFTDPHYDLGGKTITVVHTLEKK